MKNTLEIQDLILIEIEIIKKEIEKSNHVDYLSGLNIALSNLYIALSNTLK